MAKGVKTGGRRKGSLNKTTKAKVIAQSGLLPLDYFLSILRDESKPEPVRMDAAKSAAPYIHPKLASTEVKAEITGAGGGPMLKEVTVYHHAPEDDAPAGGNDAAGQSTAPLPSGPNPSLAVAGAVHSGAGGHS